MLRFHCSIHAVAGDSSSGLPIGFDEAAAAFGQLPRMFIEPDGAFVWVGQDQGRRWQVDGVLCDRGDRLAWVELRGECPAADFDRLLAIIGRPATGLVFQLVEPTVAMDELRFLRHAEFVV